MAEDAVDVPDVAGLTCPYCDFATGLRREFWWHLAGNHAERVRSGDVRHDVHYRGMAAMAETRLQLLDERAARADMVCFAPPRREIRKLTAPRVCPRCITVRVQYSTDADGIVWEQCPECGRSWRSIIQPKECA